MTVHCDIINGHDEIVDQADEGEITWDGDEVIIDEICRDEQLARNIDSQFKTRFPIADFIPLKAGTVNYELEVTSTCCQS
jgi:hypothetical protein